MGVMGIARDMTDRIRAEEELARLTADILGQSWHSLRGYKQLLNETEDLDLASGLAWEIANSPGVGPDFAERVGAKFGGR